MQNIKVTECFVEMRDGVKLYTLIMLPEATGKFPVIIKRTPYCDTETDIETIKHEATHGYAVVRQHCRGTGKSEGVCIAYKNERNDGLDLLNWVRKQPFYNGELYLSGGSYLSSVHFSYLNTNQPDIKAAFLAVQDTERYNVLYRNGVYKTGLHGKWVMGMYKRNMGVRREFVEETMLTRPLAGVTQHVFGETVQEIEAEFLHPDPADPFWQTPDGGSDYSDACNKCNIPILLVTAFYDIYTEGIFDMWKNLLPERKKSCALLVTPFSHAWNPPALTEPSELPDFENARISQVCPDMEYMWFDHFRLGTPLNFIEKGKVTYYTLFENQWHTGNNLENSPDELRFYLTDKRTLQNAPGDTGEITYTSNPAAPATFKGGVCLNFGGMQIQDEPNSRYDIISFTSDPFEEKMVCNGKIQLKLFCKSTAPDTCFYVRLSLIKDGKALSLRDDIDTLCRKTGDYTPNEEYEINYIFGDHSFEINPGDLLRLDVSSSCHPYFQVHSNRKGLQALQTGYDICRNTCVTGKSYIRLFCEKN